MTELVVRTQYLSKTRSAALALLKFTFPLWGVVSPIVVVTNAVIIITSLAPRNAWDQSEVNLFKPFCLIVCMLTLSALALVCTRALRQDFLTADRNGLSLPWLPAGPFNRFRLWKDIVALKATPPVAARAADQTLVFVTANGASTKVGLSPMKQEDIEQLLLAVEMWAPHCRVDESVTSLKQNLKMLTANSAEVSYTNMWEEELRRRFCATAFIPLEPGFALRNGSLRVIRQLALGGLSALYLCQLDEKKLVVIKEAVVPDDATESVRAKAKEMFEREASLLMRLDHANIVKVLDCFTDSGRNYMMLEYISGQDIRQFIKQNGPQKEHVVVEWAIQIASILKYLHEQDPPIIHRDLTPDNMVLRDDGSLVLIDFGAANEFLSKATGTFVGKQSFIAPEQFRGKAVPHSDIYAFGCTLYFLLTGKEPEALSTSSPRQAGATVCDDLEDFVVCCTQMEARDRFQTAAQMLPILKKISASMLVS